MPKLTELPTKRVNFTVCELYLNFLKSREKIIGLEGTLNPEAPKGTPMRPTDLTAGLCLLVSNHSCPCCVLFLPGACAKDGCENLSPCPQTPSTQSLVGAHTHTLTRDCPFFLLPPPSWLPLLSPAPAPPQRESAPSSCGKLGDQDHY